MRTTRRMRRGPESLAELASEAVLIAAGGRAILLQIADPAVGRGVAAHSEFHGDPSARLRNTLIFTYAVGCGTADDVRRAVDLVNGAHRGVRGDAHGERPAYDAADPRLQLWVAATLWDSAVRMHELVFGPLPDEVAERVYAEWTPVGASLQMPAELWPADRAAFADYWDAAVDGLTVTEDARSVADALLNPVVAPRWMRLALPLGRLATAGLLPPRLRAAFGMPWGPRRERRFRLLLTVTRLVYPRLPARVRHWPRDYCLAVLRGERRPQPAARGATA
jgi:uncharacterized protein (DUF2236 family)